MCLKINILKTKDLIINNRSEEELFSKWKKMEHVEEFCYLGSIESSREGTDKEVVNRMKKAKVFCSVDPDMRVDAAESKGKIENNRDEY